MNVLLMRPLARSKTAHAVFSPASHPDVGLGWLATAVRASGHGIQLLTNRVDGMTDEQFVALLRETNPRVVGLKVFVNSVGETVYTIGLIRATLPEAVVLIGGPQPSGDAEEILSYIPADYAYAGEGETGLPMFLNALEEAGALDEQAHRGIPGLVWRDAAGSVVCNPVALEEDLDKLGWPAWDLIPPEEHLPVEWINTRSRVTAPVVWSRGCRSHCTFCSSYRLSGRVPRTRSPENIVAEARMLKEEHGVGELLVCDDNFGHKEQYVIDVSRALAESGLDMGYQCMTGIRLSGVTEEMARWMRKGGCHDVHVGIESGANQVLKRIKKGLTTEIVERKVKILHDADISVSGYFILGFPGETREEMDQTFDLAKRIDLVRASFSIYNPLPGTELYQAFLDEGNGSAKKIDWDAIDYCHYENNLSEVPYKKLRRLQNRYYWRYHLRPRPLFHMLRSSSPLKKTAHAGRLMARYILGR